jgi:hypothetical protein
LPASREHVARAKHNLTFARDVDLNTTQYLDWVVTAYFYAALHWVDAVIADKEGIVPENHEIRREYVKKKWYLRGISKEYRDLKDRSEDARYRLTTFTKTRIEKEIEPLYQAIERHALDLLPDETA